MQKRREQIVFACMSFNNDQMPDSAHDRQSRKVPSGVRPLIQIRWGRPSTTNSHPLHATNSTHWILRPCERLQLTTLRQTTDTPKQVWWDYELSFEGPWIQQWIVEMLYPIRSVSFCRPFLARSCCLPHLSHVYWIAPSLYMFKFGSSQFEWV